MTYYVEVKKLVTTRGDSVIDNSFLAPNVTGTLTASWADAIAADEEMASGAFGIFTNSSDTDAAVAISNDAAPESFHVVQAGSQRQIMLQAGVSMRVKLL